MVQDMQYFEMLCKFDFFIEFENVEFWEVLCVFVWCNVLLNVVIICEGENNNMFGIIFEGCVEVFVGGWVFCCLGLSELIGEVVYLYLISDQWYVMVVMLEQMFFFEINVVVLVFLFEELFEWMCYVLLVRMICCLCEVNKIVVVLGQLVIVVGVCLLNGLICFCLGGGFDLELMLM